MIQTGQEIGGVCPLSVVSCWLLVVGFESRTGQAKPSTKDQGQRTTDKKANPPCSRGQFQKQGGFSDDMGYLSFVNCPSSFVEGLRVGSGDARQQRTTDQGQRTVYSGNTNSWPSRTALGLVSNVRLAAKMSAARLGLP